MSRVGSDSDSDAVRCELWVREITRDSHLDCRTAVTMSLAFITRWKPSTLTAVLDNISRIALANAADGSIVTTSIRSRRCTTFVYQLFHGRTSLTCTDRVQ